MGTSNIYNGPKDKKNNNKSSKNTTWKGLKSSVTKFLSEKSGSPKKILSNYIKCLGGNEEAFLQSEAGYNSGGRLINFINVFRESGICKALESYSIEYKGKKVSIVLSELVNKLSAESDYKEDCVAKMAVIDTLSALYKYIEDNELTLEALTNIDEQLIAELLKIFFSSYVFHKFMNDLESRFDRSQEEYDKLSEKEKEINSLIYSIVDIYISKMDLSKKIENPQDLSKQILKECYGYLKELK